MSQPKKILQVNKIKNRIDSQGISTDLLFAFFITLLVAYFSYITFNRFNLNIGLLMFLTGLPTIGVYMLLSGYKIDNQASYKILLPALSYLFYRNKRVPVQSSKVAVLQPSRLINYSEGRLIHILRMYPKNIFTLTERDKEGFNDKVSNSFLNNLRQKNISFTLRTRRATIEDYQDYFDFYISYLQETGLNNSTSADLERHLVETEAFIKSGLMSFKELYIKIWVDSSIQDASYILDRDVENITSLLHALDVQSRELQINETHNFLEKFYFRNSKSYKETITNNDIKKEADVWTSRRLDVQNNTEQKSYATN